MRNITCIVCPIGCLLEIDDSGGMENLSVTGNHCPRGEAYALEEIRSPKRIVTATCKIENTPTGSSVLRLPVKTSSPCPCSLIPALLNDIYKVKVSLPVKLGDVVIADWKQPLDDDCHSEGIDVIATRSIGL